MNAKPKKREPNENYLKSKENHDKVWPKSRQYQWNADSQEIVKSLARKYSTQYQLQKMREKGLIGT